MPLEVMQQTVVPSRPWRQLTWLAVLLFVCVFLTGLQPIRSADFWHHAASGRLVWDTGRPATHDVFSCTAQGKEWIQFEWLAQLAIFLSYTHLGVAATIILKATVIATGFVLLWIACFRRGVPVAGAIAVMAAAVALTSRSYVRPEFISWLFMGLFVLTVESVRRRMSAWAVLLPLIMVPWANTHGMYAAAIGLLGIVCGGETLKVLHGRWCGHPDGAAVRRMAWLWVVLAACLLATLVNPYGWRIWEVPFKLMGSKEVAANINEWRRTTFSDILEPHRVSLAVLLLFTAARVLHLKTTDALIVLVFAGLAASSQRHIPLFAFVCAPLFAEHLGGLAKYAASVLRVRSAPWVRYAAPGLLPLAVWSFLGPPDFSLMGLGIRHRNYPEKAADFLDHNHIEGNLFNTYTFGNYFMWRLHARNLVFIDGRVDMYGDEGMREYDRVLHASGEWEEDLARREVVACVVAMPDAGQTPPALPDALMRSPNWRLVFWDDQCFIFIRSMFRGAAGMPTFTVRPDIFDANAAGKGLIQIALKEFSLTLTRDPDCILAHRRLGGCYEVLGMLDKAEEQFRWIVASEPGSGGAHLNLGLVLAKMERYDEAEGCLRFALGHGAPQVPTLRALGNIAFTRREFAGARSFFRKALALAPRDVELLHMLALVSEELNDVTAARDYARQMQVASPNDPRAKELLERLGRGGEPRE
jgi:tetratricopeptide (TPR) repeat protein